MTDEGHLWYSFVLLKCSLDLDRGILKRCVVHQHYKFLNTWKIWRPAQGKNGTFRHLNFTLMELEKHLDSDENEP